MFKMLESDKAIDMINDPEAWKIERRHQLFKDNTTFLLWVKTINLLHMRKELTLDISDEQADSIEEMMHGSKEDLYMAHQILSNLNTNKDEK